MGMPAELRKGETLMMPPPPPNGNYELMRALHAMRLGYDIAYSPQYDERSSSKKISFIHGRHLRYDFYGSWLHHKTRYNYFISNRAHASVLYTKRFMLIADDFSISYHASFR